jgi:hypothetical protein
MLLLLKPWREFGDLTAGFSSWKEAFDSFKDNTTEEKRRIMSNIQHFCHCISTLDQERL